MKIIKHVSIVVFALSALIALVWPIGLISNTFVLGDIQPETANNTISASSSNSSMPVTFRYRFTWRPNWHGSYYDPNWKVRPTMVLDSANKPHLFFYVCKRSGSNSYVGTIYHRFLNDSDWVDQEVCSKYSSNEVREVLHADLDSRDYPHIVHTWNGQLRYAYFNGSSWVFQNITAGGDHVSVCLDSRDNLHVSFFNETGLKYTYFNGVYWNIQTVDNKANFTESQTSIRVDSNDKPHIAYSAGPISEFQSLKYACFNGISWNIETIDNEGYFPCMILDPHNSVYISYHNGSSVKYAHFDGASWEIEVVDNVHLCETEIALNSELIPHIIYCDYTPWDAPWNTRYMTNAIIKYAYRYNVRWAIQEDSYLWAYLERPCSIPVLLSYPAFGVDANDNLHAVWTRSADIRSPGIPFNWYGDYRFGIKQFLTNFTFKDNSGAPLYTNPDLIEALAPGGSIVTFESCSNQWLDRGIWTLKKVIWEGVDITPSGNVTYTSTPGGTWKIDRTTVYALKIRLKDQFDNPFSQSVTCTLPNMKLKTVTPTSGWINITQFPNGTLTIHSPIWFEPRERYTLLNSTSISVTKDTTIDSLVWLYETTDLTVSCSPSTTYVGFKVNITGKLTSSLTGGIPDVTIVLSYQVPGVPTWNLIQSVTTKSNGTFSIIWIPTATGYYTIKATWAGNEMWPPGAHNEINLAIAPYGDEYVFAVESNSVVSSLFFNSTSREIRFTVSGPTGTTGYVDITIAKSLIANIADLNVYLNGTETAYTVTSVDGSWRLHFTYHHSTYNVIVSLGSTPFIPPSLITPLTIALLTLILAIATIIVVLRIRRGTLSSILDSILR